MPYAQPIIRADLREKPCRPLNSAYKGFPTKVKRNPDSAMNRIAIHGGIWIS